MTVFDYVILTITGLSILLAVMRGLVQELLALAAWVLSFWLACTYASDASQWMPAALPDETVRYLAAFLAVFCCVWLLSAILRITVNQFVRAVGLKPIDRFLGAFFGLLRGVLLSLMLVMVAAMTSIPKSPDWRNAMFSPIFEDAALKAKPLLPASLASRIRFD